MAKVHYPKNTKKTSPSSSFIKQAVGSRPIIKCNLCSLSQHVSAVQYWLSARQTISWNNKLLVVCSLFSRLFTSECCHQNDSARKTYRNDRLFAPYNIFSRPFTSRHCAVIKTSAYFSQSVFVFISLRHNEEAVYHFKCIQQSSSKAKTFVSKPLASESRKPSTHFNLNFSKGSCGIYHAICWNIRP